MNYNIYINQRAIVELNKTLIKKLDIKDVIILDWMLKFHAEPGSKKLMMGEDHVYFWGAYALIIRENPLLDIANKETISRKVDKLIDAGLLHKFISKDKGNRTYFCITTKCYNLINRGNIPLSTEKSIPIPLKVETLSTEKSNDNNIIQNKYREGNGTAFDFLVKNYTVEMEAWQIQNKSQITDFKKFVDDYNDTVDLEELKFKPKVLFARLRRYGRNWITNRLNRNIQEPTIVPVYRRKIS